MSTTTLERKAPGESPTPAPVSILIDGRRFYDIVGELCELAEQTLQRADYYSRCFNALCKHLNASAGVFNVRLGPRTLERSFTANDTHTELWLEAIDSLVLRAQTDETAMATVYTSKAGEAVACAIAAPLFSFGGKPFGAISLVIPTDDSGHSESALVQLSRLLELIVENAPSPAKQPQPNDGDNSKALQSVVRASDFQSINQLCFAIVNSLCGKLRCEQIGMGMVYRRDVRLIAVSGLSEVPKSTPGMMAVRQAMAVAYDRNETSVVQEAGRLVDQVESSPCKIHDIWHRTAGGSCVATIPLRIDGDCVAVISLRRPATQPFTSDDLNRAKVLAESFAPALPLVNRASRSLPRHLLDATARLMRGCYSWHGLGKKAIAALLFAGAFWMAFGRMNYEVLAPCRIVPENINSVAAPYDGMIANVVVQPGQAVKQGQLLVQIDTEQLSIERSKILSEIASTKIQANAFLQERKPQDAFQLQAQIRVLDTDLQLIQEQIKRARIRAKVDGVVLPTDIHRRVGQYVNLGEQLLEIASDQQWHLEIETPESDARHLALEQTGSFQTNARPDQYQRCEITKISPSTQVVRQKNVIVAEAVLHSREDWMKIGMEGHIRIDTGKQPVWWVYLHPIFDYARLKLWL